MNIWYLHHYATPYELAGLHRPFEFGSHLCKSGDRMAVFTSSYLHFSGDNIIKGKEKRIVRNYDGIDAVFVKTSGYDNIIQRIINMLQYWKRVVSSAKWYAEKNWKPDVIIASSPHPMTMLSGLKLAKKFGVPCICEVRDFWPEDFFYDGIIKEKSLFGKFLLRVERYIYEKADKLVFLKEGDYTYISDRKWDTGHGGKVDLEKCRYINNGVDIALFDERLKQFRYDDGEVEDGKHFDIVYTGTIRPGNHIDQILDVAKLVNDDIRFLVYGTGNCVEDLKERIAREHIGNVLLKGYIDNKYIPSVLNKASLAILNYSDTDYNWSRGNSSNKLFEYLASGKPVLSTVKIGYDILSRYGCGISAEKCTPESIAEAVQQMYDMSDADYDSMCKNARNASLKFNIPVLAEKYRSVMEESIRDYGNGRN